MTVAEMFTYVQEALNKEATGSIFPEEFEVLINAAQLEKVQNVYAEFEATQKRIDDLRRITVGPVSIPNTGTNVAGQEIFQLPIVGSPAPGQSRGYMFLLSAGFKIQYVESNCGTGVSSVLKGKPLRRDKRYEIANDPYNKPKETRLYYIIDSDQIRLYTGGSSYGVEAVVEYLRYPVKIELVFNTIDCELPEHMHKEICDLATRKYLEQTQSPRFQTTTIEQRTINS